MREPLTTDNRQQPENRLKSQIQNPKSQTNSKFKIPNLTWNLELGTWNAPEGRSGLPFLVAAKSKILYKDRSFSGEIAIFVDWQDKGSIPPQGGGQIPETD